MPNIGGEVFISGDLPAAVTYLRLKNLQITDNRRETLAGKRQEKRNRQSMIMPPLTSQIHAQWVSPPASIQTEEETRHFTSISNPSKSSAGSQLFHACQERESEALGNIFSTATLFQD